MSFHTIWSVDLGKSALKAVKLRRDRNHVEILAIDKVDYPPGPTGVDSQSQAEEALSVFRTRNEVKDPLIIAHPGQGTFSRFIKVPAFESKKVKDMVRYEASQQIPFPLDEVIWDFHLIEREYLAGEEREIGLFAVRKEAIDDFLVGFTKENLTVEMLTIGYLGLLNFVLYDVHPEEPTIVLDIGATHTDLIFVDGQRFWIRPLPHSGSDVTRAIMSRFKLDFPEAENLKLEAAKVPKQAAKVFQAVIQPKLQELVQEVHRSIGYYRSQAGEIKFTKLLLLGNGSKILGIKKHLEEHLGMPVDRCASISRLRVNRDVNVKLLQADLPAFGTAFGCGIQAVGLGTCNVDLIPKEEKVKKEIHRKKKHAFFAAGIVLLAILVAHLVITKAKDKALAAMAESKQGLPAKFVDKEIDDIEKRSQTELFTRMETLREVAEARQGALSALRVLEEVLASIPSAVHQDLQLKSDDKEGIQKAIEKGLADLDAKLWVPYLSVEAIQYPEAKEKGPRGSSRPGAEPVKAGPDAVVPVPAYKVKAYVVIRSRETATEANAAVQKLFAEPVSQKLKVGQYSVDHVVKVNPGTDQLSNVYWDPSGRAASSEAQEQVGKPFYGAEVVWTMLPRHPAKVVEVEKPEVTETKPAPNKKRR